MEQVPGHTKATTSLVLGIVGVACWVFGYSAAISVITGIAGLVLAAQAKTEGNNEGIRTAGFVLSLISTIVGGLIFAACVACAGAGCAGIGALTLFN